MDGELGAAIVGVVLFLTMGGVILMRPVTKRLGQFLEVLIDERRGRLESSLQTETRRSVELLEDRLAAVEQRVI